MNLHGLIKSLDFLIEHMSRWRSFILYHWVSVISVKRHRAFWVPHRFIKLIICSLIDPGISDTAISPIAGHNPIFALFLFKFIFSFDIFNLDLSKNLNQHLSQYVLFSQQKLHDPAFVCHGKIADFVLQSLYRLHKLKVQKFTSLFLSHCFLSATSALTLSKHCWKYTKFCCPLVAVFSINYDQCN